MKWKDSVGRLRGGQIRGEAIVGGETKREQNSFESGVFPRCLHGQDK